MRNSTLSPRDDGSDEQHTPGPWELSDETLRDDLRSKLVYGSPEGMLAIVRVENQGGHYGDANARLIAAAPELLEACQRTIQMLETIEAKTLVGDEGCLWGVEIVRAAIAKATQAPDPRGEANPTSSKDPRT